MSEQEFVQGLFVDEKTFDWGSITTLSFKAKEFAEWLQANTNEKGYVNVDVKTAQSGKKYAVKNTFVPKKQDGAAPKAAPVVENDFDDEIPF